MPLADRAPKIGIGIGQRSAGRRNLEDEQRHGKTSVNQRMLDDLAKTLGCGGRSKPPLRA